MKKLFFGLLVLVTICSCENREIAQEEQVSNENLINNEPKLQSRDSIFTEPGTGIGPVVTIPPR